VALAMLVLFAVGSSVASWLITLISALLVLTLCAGELLLTGSAAAEPRR
jgi:hypothetical protein